MMNEEPNVVQDLPIFICNTVVDAESQEEATGFAMKKRQLYTDLFLYGSCGLMILYLIIDTVRTQSYGKNAVLLAVVLGLLIYMAIARKTLPRKTMERWEASVRRKYGTNGLHLTTEFYERSLAQTLMEDEDQLACTGYSAIFELQETENLFLLRYGKNLYYFVSKKGFTKGSPEAFRSFIQEKIGGK
ncbi:MAG: YcxB family protein [Oscillospiraceae bacterium]|nr:YcxB family protein [Oscillospiraceae bacterium]